MNLDEVTTQDLFDELGKRFEGLLLYGVKFPDLTNPAYSQTIYKYKGGAVHALGMCEMMKQYVLQDVSVNELPVDEI